MVNFPSDTGWRAPAAGSSKESVPSSFPHFPRGQFSSQEANFAALHRASNHTSQVASFSLSFGLRAEGVEELLARQGFDALLALAFYSQGLDAELAERAARAPSPKGEQLHDYSFFGSLKAFQQQPTLFASYKSERQPDLHRRQAFIDVAEKESVLSLFHGLAQKKPPSFKDVEGVSTLHPLQTIGLMAADNQVRSQVKSLVKEDSLFFDPQGLLSALLENWMLWSEEARTQVAARTVLTQDEKMARTLEGSATKLSRDTQNKMSQERDAAVQQFNDTLTEETTRYLQRPNPAHKKKGITNG